MAWFGARSFQDYLLGDRRRLGDDWAVVEHLAATQPRARINWALPVLATLLAFAMMVFHWTWATASWGAGGMMFRIFVIDYTLFFFGLLSGYDMARRWRTTPEMIEELSLTPLPPAAVASALVAAPCAVWWRVLAGLALVECLLPVPHFAWVLEGAWSSGGGNSLQATTHVLLLVLSIGSALVLPWVLAWFHYESVRLAHWMFAVHAIPRVSLVGAGISNFIAMSFAVVLLSGIGSAVTGTLWMVILAVLMAIAAALQDSTAVENMFGLYSVWGLSAIAGAVAVAFIKRGVARLYVDAFTRSWLLYTWWGAAERTQPTIYPMSMRGRLPTWEAYYGMVAEQNANVPIPKRYKTAYYKSLLKAQENNERRERQFVPNATTYAPTASAAVVTPQAVLADDFLAPTRPGAPLADGAAPLATPPPLPELPPMPALPALPPLPAPPAMAQPSPVDVAAPSPAQEPQP